jgi:hypothetical protein
VNTGFFWKDRFYGCLMSVGTRKNVLMCRKTSVFLLLMLLGVTPSTAQDGGSPKVVAKQRELVAVVPHSWKPQYDRDKNGKPIRA